jgi:hypothetical protein
VYLERHALGGVYSVGRAIFGRHTWKGLYSVGILGKDIFWYRHISAEKPWVYCVLSARVLAMDGKAMRGQGIFGQTYLERHTRKGVYSDRHTWKGAYSDRHTWKEILGKGAYSDRYTWKGILEKGYIRLGRHICRRAYFV